MSAFDTIREALEAELQRKPPSPGWENRATRALAALAEVEAERDALIVRLGVIIVTARELEGQYMSPTLRAAINVGEDEHFNRPTAEGKWRRTMLDAEAIVLAQGEALREASDHMKRERFLDAERVVNAALAGSGE